MESARRLLACIECPFFSSVDLSCQSDCIQLIMWLEDVKIRRLDYLQRDFLRQYNASWDNNFSNYLTLLDCPFSWTPGSIDCITWLIGHAVSLVYEDCVESYIETSEEDNSNDMVLHDEAAATAASDARDIDSIGQLLGLSRLECESNPGAV
jgi:RNA transcription, translation and transport factor protein